MNSSTFAEPFTPRGVAAFARGKFNRLTIAQALFALLGAASVAWFLNDSCFPTIETGIQNLPGYGDIRGGKLDWVGKSPTSLAQGRIFSVNLDLNHSGAIQSTADFQIEFGKNSVRVFSLLGYTDFIYPPGEIISFNRPELEPLWNAWDEIILFGAALATAVLLPFSWWILATLYCLPAWLFVFYSNRDLNLRQCWKLSAASLFPGALLMAAGIFAYDFGLLTLVEFAFVFAAHLVLGWIYLITSLIFIPRHSKATPKGNPFEVRN
ncbi:MAG TPA: hypothetical protein VFV23_10985 [Verrucomicrobiae bacterium]|nr:hypothetical protein [Verrucomicrobiae bacterium]